MKLWDKGYTVNNLVERYTVGNDREWDQRLIPFDIQTNRAHAAMLHQIGLLSAEEWNALAVALDELQKQWETEGLTIGEEFEDVHSWLEHLLTEKCGDAGRKIHTARSRNDQVLTDLHLYAKASVVVISEAVITLFDQLMELAEEHKDRLLPGYTHMQVAMPSSFGLWFSAYAESLVDDMLLLQAAYRMADQNPLGSAAGYGSSFPINRTLTTELLGFGTMRYNSVGAQMSRGRLEKSVSFALSSISATLGKLADDICLYMSQNFGFVTFPKELTTGSSIMPHKQNPDVFEVMRARCNSVQQSTAHLTLLTANLISGYHRDFQELKGVFMESIETTIDNLEVATFMLKHIQVQPEIVGLPIYDAMYTVESLHELVLKGMPFRTAYQQLGKEVNDGTFIPNRDVHHTHEGSIGNLCLGEIRQKMEAVKVG
ncbi:MAG: argininosuccinate lyase [Flavobacteriales bacterium]|nr:argininosuccinate lyase [Flavobacteriales bacterium]